MRAKKKLSKGRKLLNKIIYISLAVFLTLVVFFELTVRDRIELAIIAQIKNVSNSTINSAVGEYIKENASLSKEMIEINSDDNGNVKSITENAFSVNAFKTDIINCCQEKIDEVFKTHGIDVQLGNFTGLTILSEFGPYVAMDIDATSTITCDILSTFESNGVNQTLHRLELVMYVDIYVGNPIRIESVAFSTSYEISQTVIVGSIPSAYGTISRY
ncbi:MAG: hypothetical protein IJO20_06920 [Ruminococcus sp.]|nr:hypothetical protein [Ruminococcus sp.]